ncbi:hypothetical protein [Bacillus subtilis]|uniref:hypothetical protein n=1 Tax=Bacillus subtilis TaxID=1423 RepID=UPI002DB8CE47|nr:hypothetical protein [Bacillus subtilis]MEC0285505.1 hypothetical protein [Bacillus subtilis]MEC0481468.1 hypothetical protein [Bacillus subtilis]MEC0522186.1 hypothetical protein [Bacillus subtilis]
MAATKAEKKDAKDLCELILASQGVSYDDWLHDEHNAVVSKHSNILKKAVKQMVSKPATSEQHN